MKCKVITPEYTPPPSEYVLTLTEDEAKALKRLCGFLNGFVGIAALRAKFPRYDFSDANDMRELAGKIVSYVPVMVRWAYQGETF